MVRKDIEIAFDRFVYNYYKHSEVYVYPEYWTDLDLILEFVDEALIGYIGDEDEYDTE